MPKDVEVLGPATSTATDLVAQGAAIVRIENETLMQVAVQRPRDEDRVLEGALKELDRVPDLAERVYYSIPYKNHRKGCRNRRDCDCPMTYVRGMGIKGALNLARRWGNCTITARIVGEDEEAVHVEGTFLDLETNTRISTVRSVPKYRTWGGKRVHLNDERLQQAVAADAAKAKRNAILDGLPDWLVESYYRKARELAAAQDRAASNGAGPTERVVQAFAQLGVSAEMLERHLGHPIEAISDEELADLRGLFNALRDGEREVGEVFGPAPGSSKPAHEEAFSVDQVLSAGADVTGGTEKPKAQAAASVDEEAASELFD